MITREATIEDWDALLYFFKKVYRANHPLHNKAFWIWQYGDKQYGRSFICVNEKGNIVGHVGANFGGNVAWIINVYLDEECRGKGILGKLYALARQYYPLAATAANADSQRSKAAAGPEAMMVNSPAAARTEPPEMGASR